MLPSGKFQPYVQHMTRLEKLAKYKHSSLLRKSVNYGQKSFITMDPGVNGIPFFFVSDKVEK